MFDIKLVLKRKQANKCTLEVIHIVKLIFFVGKTERESKLDEERKKRTTAPSSSIIRSGVIVSIDKYNQKKRRELLKVTLFGAWKSPFRIEIRG